MFYCFRLQKVIEYLVLKGPLQLFNPPSPLYRGGNQVFHSDLQKVKVAVGKARNGKQACLFVCLFSFQVVEKNCIHFVVCKISDIIYSCNQTSLRWASLWSNGVGLGGAFFFNPFVI